MSQHSRKVFLYAFLCLYVLTATVSCVHAVTFFSLGNPTWLAILLSLSFEIGQSACLLTILLMPKAKLSAYIMTVILTAVQIAGNVYCTYRHIITSSPDDVIYFSESLLFFITHPTITPHVIISYIMGGILPGVCLGLTSIATFIMPRTTTTQNKKSRKTTPTPPKTVI